MFSVEHEANFNNSDFWGATPCVNFSEEMAAFICTVHRVKNLKFHCNI